MKISINVMTVRDLLAGVGDRLAIAPAFLLEQIRPLPQQPQMYSASSERRSQSGSSRSYTSTSAGNGAQAVQPGQVQQAQALLQAYGIQLDLSGLAQGGAASRYPASAYQQAQATTTAAQQAAYGPYAAYGHTAATTANAYAAYRQPTATAQAGTQPTVDLSAYYRLLASNAQGTTDSKTGGK